MSFGENNDYPQVTEMLINSSKTAKSASKIYAKFLTGKGFESDINEIIVGKDTRGKDITIKDMLSLVCSELSKHNGCYVFCSESLERKVGSVKLIPFKNCRFSKTDNDGYSAKVVVNEDWTKKENLKTYNIFNLNEAVFNSQVAKIGAENFKGQVNYLFFDNDYLYPLSPFDSVAYDMDTENQLSIFKNNQIRNGFSDKTIFRITGENETETDKIAESLKNMMGADGDNSVILEAELDPTTNTISKDSNVVVDKITTNINSKLFENWEKTITNDIRKSPNAIPLILIDYEENKLGGTSGESIIQACNYYNAMTDDNRAMISRFFKEMFQHSVNETLANTTNWNITKLSLYDTNLGATTAVKAVI